MARTATKPRRLTVDIREERVSGFAPLVEGKPRVDRDKGIIYGVKVVGRSSPNTHGVQGVEGTDYTREALESELPQIEGINVNIDHPPRENAGQVRSARDRFAWISEARIADDCIFGDMHFLDPKDPLAIRIMNAAESKPDAFALSHNALGKGDVKNKRYVISEVMVRSVDIVTAGGTNRSLFESRQNPMPKIKIKKLFEAAGDKVKVSPKKFPLLHKAVKRLLEDDEYGVMDQESEGEAPADHEEALKEGFRASVAHIVDACLSGDEDPKECIKRIGELLKTHDKLSDDGDEDLEEEDDSDDDKPKDDDKPADDKKDDAKKVEESRKHCTRLAKGYLQLQESQQPPKSLIEALVKLPDEDARLSLLESWPKGSVVTPPGKGSSPPRSSPLARPIQESAVPKDAKEQATLLLR